MEIAIDHCRNHLDKQIITLLPKKVLSLGNTVTQQYFGMTNHLNHGSSYKYAINGHSFDLVFSIFPSRNTADLWIQYREWQDIIPKMIEPTSRNKENTDVGDGHE